MAAELPNLFRRGRSARFGKSPRGEIETSVEQTAWTRSCLVPVN